MEAELFHAEGRTNRQTDMTKLIVAFRNFSRAPKNNIGNQLDAYATLTVLPTSLFSYVFLNYVAQCFYTCIFCWCWHMRMITWILCIFPCINSNAIKGGFTQSMPCPCRAHAVPLPCRGLIHTCHAAPLLCSDSAVSFVKVRVVAGNIRTASPRV